MKNCLNCDYFEKDKDKQEGICEFPSLACIKKQKIIIGIPGRFKNGEHGMDYHKVGHHTETGMKEIKDCPMWKLRIFKPKIVVPEPTPKEAA